MKKLAIMTLMALFVFSNVNAAPLGIGHRTITTILTYNGHGGMLYQTDSMVHNGCPSNGYYILPKTHSFYKENKELIHTARILNSKVWLTIEGCFENYPMIRNVSY